MTTNPDAICARCGHERWHHLDFHGRPRACSAKDDGEQCQDFIEPTHDALRERIRQLEALARDYLTQHDAMAKNIDDDACACDLCAGALRLLEGRQ